jgi:hypothetical protein
MAESRQIHQENHRNNFVSPVGIEPTTPRLKVQEIKQQKAEVTLSQGCAQPAAGDSTNFRPLSVRRTAIGFQ